MLADGVSIDILFLDFLKAFDMVPHRRLLKKLEGYGMNRGMLRWCESFLTRRRQRVVLGECVSEWMEVTSGVPLGSVLGPLFFIVYINDLPECISSKTELYADDSKLIAIVRDLAGALSVQDDLNAVSEWSKDWLMRLNVNKCKVMHLGNSNLRFSYDMEDIISGTREMIQVTDREKDQGVMICSSLDWGEQVRSAAAKANKVLGLLRNTFNSRDLVLWKKLYTSLVRPHLEYAAPVWNPHKEKHIELIEKVQRRATKIPVGLAGIPYEERLKAWGLTSLEERRIRGDLIQIYKCLNGIEEVHWHTGPRFPTNPYGESAFRGCKGRNNRSLARECFPAKKANNYCHFVTVRHEFFLNRVTESWNRLPNEVVEAPSVNSFKAKLDRFLMNNGCYGSL